MTEVIGIISIKGGVGKTTTAVNLAYSLANFYNKRVLLIDANLSSPNIGLHLGVAEPERTLYDVLADRILANEALYTHSYNFDVIFGSLVKKISTSPQRLKEKLKGIKKRYDIIIIDSSPTLNKELLSVMMASDKIFVITTPDPITLKMTTHAANVAKDRGVAIAGIILNKISGRSYEIGTEKIESKTKVPVIATITDHLKVCESLSRMKPLVMAYPNSKPAREFRKLAAALVDAEYKEPSLFSKIMGYIKEDYTNFKDHKFKEGLVYYK